MTSKDFDEMLAFWHLEPFGDIREDERAKMIAQNVVNSSGIKKPYKRTHEIFQIVDAKARERKKIPLLSRWKSFVRLHNKAVSNGDNSKSSS